MIALAAALSRCRQVFSRLHAMVFMSSHSSATSQASTRAAVLIVEDELLVRLFATDALEDVGFEVLQAGDAQQALDVMREGPVAAVIIDMGLPDQPGDELAARLRQMHPTLPMLIASGRTERELKEHFKHDAYVQVLVKPYTAPMLISALETLGVMAPT